MPYKDKKKQKQNHRLWQKKNYQEKLGTTDFEPHLERDENGDPDFIKEEEDINNEFKRLHLKRKF